MAEPWLVVIRESETKPELARKIRIELIIIDVAQIAMSDKPAYVGQQASRIAGLPDGICGSALIELRTRLPTHKGGTRNTEERTQEAPCV